MYDQNAHGDHHGKTAQKGKSASDARVCDIGDEVEYDVAVSRGSVG